MADLIAQLGDAFPGFGAVHGLRGMARPSRTPRHDGAGRNMRQELFRYCLWRPSSVHCGDARRRLHVHEFGSFDTGKTAAGYSPFCRLGRFSPVGCAAFLVSQSAWAVVSMCVLAEQRLMIHFYYYLVLLNAVVCSAVGVTVFLKNRYVLVGPCWALPWS